MKNISVFIFELITSVSAMLLGTVNNRHLQPGTVYNNFSCTNRIGISRQR